jgi:hypothetical protein
MTTITNFNIEEVITECSYKEDDVCLSDKLISKIDEYIVEVQNESDPRKKIEVSKKVIGCGDQACIIDHMHKKKLINDHEYKGEMMNIKPSGPAVTKDWLNDLNIKEVLHRYNQKFRKRKGTSFYYFPYQMIDFMEFNTSFARADWPQLMEYYNTFGVVINTDRWKTKGAGIHWFCLFIDARKKPLITVEYFNSSGNRPLIEIVNWYHNVFETSIESAKQGLTSQFIRAVDHEIQKDKHSCGVYCLFYIYYRLLGVSVEEFKSLTNTDAKMNEFRKFLFRTQD